MTDRGRDQARAAGDVRNRVVVQFWLLVVFGHSIWCRFFSFLLLFSVVAHTLCIPLSRQQKYIQNNISERFDGYYASEYIRALETAALLGFSHARWQLEFYLREKDQGILAGKSHVQRAAEFSDQLDRLKKDSFYVAPPGGESVANSCLRVDRVLSEWRTDRSGQSIVVVCHGNIMSAFRVRLEGLTQSQFRAIEKSNDKMDKMHNGQILHYTRRDPRTGQIRSHPKWMKSICPWDLSLSKNEWEPINNSLMTNDDLLDEVNRVVQLINPSKDDKSASGEKPDD